MVRLPGGTIAPLLITLIAACGPATAVDAGSGEAGPLPKSTTGLLLCDEKRHAGVVSGQVSADAEVAAAQQWRADNGLQSDANWVEEFFAQPSGLDVVDGYGFPVTADEALDLETWQASFDVQALYDYSDQHLETRGRVWFDNAARTLSISFSSDVEQRRAEIAELFPEVRVVESPEDLSGSELLTLQGELLRELEAGGLVEASSAIEFLDGRGFIAIEVPVLDERTIAKVGEIVDPDVVCLSGRDPDEFAAAIAPSQRHDSPVVAGVDGPVIRHESTTPPVVSLTAGIGGILEIDGPCLYLVFGFDPDPDLPGLPTESRTLPVWPSWTTWDPNTQQVVLPAGQRVSHGDLVSGWGPGARTVHGAAGDDGSELAEQCSKAEDASIFNNSPDQVELAGGPLRPLMQQANMTASGLAAETGINLWRLSEWLEARGQGPTLSPSEQQAVATVLNADLENLPNP